MKEHIAESSACTLLRASRDLKGLAREPRSRERAARPVVCRGGYALPRA